MTSAPPPVIPELDVSDLDRSLEIYTAVLGFVVHVLRPEERFAYLIRGAVHLMLEEADGPGRRFRTAVLDRPFGRGMNLQIEVPDVDELFARVVRAELRVVVTLEDRWYRHGVTDVGLRQFVVADPDGYLLRFATPLGRRDHSGLR